MSLYYGNINYDRKGNRKHAGNLLRLWFHSWLCLWFRLFLEPWGIHGSQWSTSSLTKPSRSIALCQIYEENQQVVICTHMATAYQYRSPSIISYVKIVSVLNHKSLSKVWCNLAVHTAQPISLIPPRALCPRSGFQ